MLFASFAAAFALALVHLFAGKLRFLDVTPRSRWLSFAGGISVAYIFVHLLPELGEAQDVLSETVGAVFAALEHHVYLLALAGLVVFYGLERMVQESREEQRESEGEDRTSNGVFWIHIVSFAIYNALIGYILAEPGEGLLRLVLFAVAMLLHFLVNDYGLREHHKELYRRTGRWVLAATVLIGWGLGVAWEVPELALLIPTAFLAGGIIMNVLKEELPEERESRFWAFAAGAAGYAALLLAV